MLLLRKANNILSQFHRPTGGPGRGRFYFFLSSSSSSYYQPRIQFSSIHFPFLFFPCLRQVSWNQNSFPLQPTDRRTMSSRGNRHTLTIRHVQQEDFGNYRLVVDSIFFYFNRPMCVRMCNRAILHSGTDLNRGSNIPCFGQMKGNDDSEHGKKKVNTLAQYPRACTEIVGRFIWARSGYTNTHTHMQAPNEVTQWTKPSWVGFGKKGTRMNSPMRRPCANEDMLRDR